MSFVAVSAMKNEGAFLLEWVAHLRGIGFDQILVFSNDCDDGTDAMLDRLQTLDHVTHLRNPGPWTKGPQWDALNAAVMHPLVKAAEWIMFIDVDEFPNIHVGDGTVQALVAALPEATAIPLTWRMFGNCGQVSFEDLPVTEQFRRAAPARIRWPWRLQMFKTLFRNDGSYRKLGVHRPRALAPEAAPRWFDGSGRELPKIYHKNRLFSLTGEDNYQLAQLNHYALGAMETYIVKCDRGRANRDASAFDMSYWVERNFCETEDLTIARYSDSTLNARAELLADPRLADLHAGAVKWRRDRFEALMMDEEYRALFGRLLITPPSRPMPKPLEDQIVYYGMRANGLI